MTLESDVNHMLRTLTRKELNAYTVSYNELVKQGNTGHVDEILWDAILQVGGEWPSSSSSASGPTWVSDCMEYSLDCAWDGTTSGSGSTCAECVASLPDCATVCAGLGGFASCGYFCSGAPFCGCCCDFVP